MEKWKNINIIYEDNHLLVVIKPENMPACKDESKDLDLHSLMKEYIKTKYNKQGNVYLGLIHRLDRPTYGIMVFAKTSKSAERLSKQIQNKEFHKTYYAVVCANLEEDKTFIDYLYKDKSSNTSYISNKSKGKLAILEYKIIKKVNNLSLVKINLLTGRHHQIRVQFSNRNAPLYGDHKYNKLFINDNKSNLALVAKEVSFIHPTTKETLHFNIELPKKYPYTLF